MSNQVTAEIHINELGEWYDIQSIGDPEAWLEEIKEKIRDGIDEVGAEETPLEDIQVSFNEHKLPSLFRAFDVTPDNLGELIEAIEYLENADNDLEVYEAYEDNMGTSPSSASDIEQLIEDADEAYQGEYRDDEKFAQEMADQLGAVDKNASWPMNCIDWEFAAKELMYDYFESNGHYFRNI